MAWTRTGLILAFVGVALLIAGPLGTRAGLWTFLVGFGVLALSLLCAVAAVVLSLIGAVTSGQLSLPALGMAAALAVMAFPGTMILSARGAPPIHEIKTDPQDPPPFVTVLSLRASAMNPPEYGGAEVAAQQLRAYPDIQPLMLRLNASQAFQRALAVVHELGWEEVGSDAASAVSRPSIRPSGLDSRTMWSSASARWGRARAWMCARSPGWVVGMPGPTPAGFAGS